MTAGPVGSFTIAGDRVAVEVLDLGATIRQVWLDDVPLTLAHDDLTAYADPEQNPYYGAFVGRFANRIGGAAFDLDGRTHRLVANEGSSVLHGGPDGFSWRRWEVTAVDDRSIAVSLHSPAGDQGFPGALDVVVTYTVSGGSLSVDAEARTDAPTVVNLTTHPYWNLSGAVGSVADHVLTVDADEVLVVDPALVPTGEERPVDDTPFDCRSGRLLETAIDALPATAGYDHCFVASGVAVAGEGPDASGRRRLARLEHTRSGRWLEVHSDQPALQVYTGGMHDPPNVSVCLEPQGFPDAPNQPSFPSTVLRPGEAYRHHTEFRFGS